MKDLTLEELRVLYEGAQLEIQQLRQENHQLREQVLQWKHAMREELKPRRREEQVAR